MGRFQWSVRSVSSQSASEFASRLETTLNGLEEEGFNVEDLLDRAGGLIVVGKKPRGLRSGVRA